MTYRLTWMLLTINFGWFGLATADAAFIFNPDNGHFYGLTDSELNWDLAEAEAVGLGGHLASITSQAEQDFLLNNFVVPNTPGGEKQPFWIGATDELSEGTYLWTTGELFDYTNWNPGEPNNIGDEDYLAFNWHYAVDQNTEKGTWNDTPIDGDTTPGPYRGIIELNFDPASAVPEPASLTLVGLGAVGMAIGAYRRRKNLPASRA